MTDVEWRAHCIKQLAAAGVQVVTLPSGVMRIKSLWCEFVLSDIASLTRDDLKRICRTG